MNIAVIGAGHAGVQAAAQASRNGAQVVLFSNEAVLPYFRPRLPGVAFKQMQPESIFMHPLAWYADHGIELRLKTAVSEIDSAKCSLISSQGREVFDALVFANGSVPLLPACVTLQPDLPVFTLWNMNDALRIRECAASGRRLIVVGGGILGLEAALRAREAGLKVTILERELRMMPMQFDEAASILIKTTLEQLDIAVLLGGCLTSLKRSGKEVRLQLKGGETLDTDIVLFAIGATPNIALAETAGIDVAAGVVVDPCQQTQKSRIFAAGDVAQMGLRRPPSSVRNASEQGKQAGLNASALVAGKPLQSHQIQSYPVFFKSREIELYAIGATAGEGRVEERLDDGSDPACFRAVVKEGDQIVGVQMIGTRKGFDALMAQMSAKSV